MADPISDAETVNLEGYYNLVATTPSATFDLSGIGQVTLGEGVNAVTITSGADTIFAAADSPLTAINSVYLSAYLFGPPGSLSLFFYLSDADEAGLTALHYGGSLLFHAAPSSTEALDLVKGLASATTIIGAANNVVVYDGINNRLGSGALLVAGSGNETLIGAASLGAAAPGYDQFWGSFSGGNDLMVAGSGNDALIAGTGNDTLIGGTGNDVFYVTNTRLLIAITEAGVIPGQDLIDNVHAGDVLALTGYDPLYGGAGSAAAAVSSVLASGSNMVTLRDGTSIAFAGDTQALKVVSS